MRIARFLLSTLLYLIAFNCDLVGQILVGPKVGFNLGVFSVDNQAPGAKNSLRFGWTFGGIGELRISDNLSFQVEPTYIEKGTKVSFFDGIRQVDSDLRFSYLQIPLTVKAKISAQAFSPYAFVGPNLGFLLSAKAESNLGGYQHESDLTSDYRKTDIAIDAGLGFELPLTEFIILTADARYSFGLSNIDARKIGAVRTRGVQLFIGTLFQL